MRTFSHAGEEQVRRCHSALEQCPCSDRHSKFEVEHSLTQSISTGCVSSIEQHIFHTIYLGIPKPTKRASAPWHRQPGRSLQPPLHKWLGGLILCARLTHSLTLSQILLMVWGIRALVRIRCMHQQSGWYGERWLGWKSNNSLTDLHPVEPEAFKRIVVQPLLQLTPALRTLHLDAKKGRDNVGAAVKKPRERSDSPSSASGSGSSEDGVEVQNNYLRQPDEKTPAGGYDDDAGTFAGEHIDGTGSSKWKPQRGVCNGSVEGRINGRAVHKQRGVEGCETKIVARWTERQRTMCLIPDLGGGDGI